jgi:hypothetical protein
MNSVGLDQLVACLSYMLNRAPVGPSQSIDMAEQFICYVQQRD